MREGIFNFPVISIGQYQLDVTASGFNPYRQTTNLTVDRQHRADARWTSFTEGRSLELRLEMFNVFNHTQFYPNGSVDGNISDVSTAGRNNEAIEQVVMRLSIEDDVSTLTWWIAEPTME